MNVFRTTCSRLSAVTFRIAPPIGELSCFTCHKSAIDSDWPFGHLHSRSFSAFLTGLWVTELALGDGLIWSVDTVWPMTRTSLTSTRLTTDSCGNIPSDYRWKGFCLLTPKGHSLDHMADGHSTRQWVGEIFTARSIYCYRCNGMVRARVCVYTVSKKGWLRTLAISLSNLHCWIKNWIGNKICVIISTTTTIT